MSTLNIVVLFIIFFVTSILSLITGFYLGIKSKKIIQSINEKVQDSTNNALNDALVKTNEHLMVQQSQKLQDVLTPFKEEMKEFKERVNTIHTEEVKQVASLNTNIEQLHTLQHRLTKETEGLSKALRHNVKLQGIWGEQILEQILQSSGYLKGYHYRSQVPLHDDQHKLKQPDFIIDLPEGRSIIIDAKVSLENYTRYYETDVPSEKEQELKNIKESIKNHIKGLSSKEYHSLSGVNTIQGVLLFIPIESLFILLVEKHLDIFKYASDLNIYLTSPANLIPLIQLVKHMWVVDNRNRNTMQIADLGAKIYDKLVGMTQDLDKVYSSIDNAKKNLDQFNTKLQGRGNIVNLAQKLKDYGSGSDKKLSEQWVYEDGDLPFKEIGKSDEQEQGE